MICLAGLTSLVRADQDRDNNPAAGLNVGVQLRHQVVIPRILYFRVGSAVVGEVDKVTFDLNSSFGFASGNNQGYAGGSIPLGDANAVAATSSNNGSLVVDLRSNVGSITLSYEVSSTSGLSDGAGHFIAFDQIETTSSDVNLPPPVLSNTGGASGSSAATSTVTGNFFGGRVVKRQATWTYRYKNETVPVAGTYDGRISYTASAP